MSSELYCTSRKTSSGDNYWRTMLKSKILVKKTTTKTIDKSETPERQKLQRSLKCSDRSAIFPRFFSCADLSLSRLVKSWLLSLCGPSTDVTIPGSMPSACLRALRAQPPLTHTSTTTAVLPQGQPLLSNLFLAAKVNQCQARPRARTQYN